MPHARPRGDSKLVALAGVGGERACQASAAGADSLADHSVRHSLCVLFSCLCFVCFVHSVRHSCNTTGRQAGNQSSRAAQAADAADAARQWASTPNLARLETQVTRDSLPFSAGSTASAHALGPGLELGSNRPLGRDVTSARRAGSREGAAPG